MFTISGDSGQTVPGSHGSASAGAGVHSLSRCLGLHQTDGAVGASLGATAQPITLAFKARRWQLGRSYHTSAGGEDDISLPVDGHSSVRRDAVQGQMPSGRSWPRVHATLPATGTIRCSLHEPPCVAGCPGGIRELAGGTRLMFIHVSEASGFLPVAEGHPVLLDVSTTEILGDIETSASPLSLRGFELHTVLVPLAEGGKARNIISPRFQGGNASALISYDEETDSTALGPQPPMRISLCAPSQDHWTIVLDTVIPSTIEEYRRLREQAVSKPTKAGALPSSSSDKGAGRTEAAPSRERALQLARSVLDQAHALQLQSMRDLGCIRDLDRTLAGTLMAEFSRIQLIAQEDVRKSLVAVRSDLLATCSAFVADVG